MADTRTLNETQQKLVLDNMRLVNFAIAKYVSPPSRDEYEDYLQTGYLGLCLAALNYDKNSGIKFGSYAIKAIINTIYEYRRYSSNIKKPKKWGKAHFEINDQILDNLDKVLDKDVVKAICSKLNITERQYMICLPTLNLSQLLSEDETNISHIDVKDNSQNMTAILEYESDILNICLEKIRDILLDKAYTNEEGVSRFLDYIYNSYHQIHLSEEDIKSRYGISRQAYYKSIKKYKDYLVSNLHNEDLKYIRNVINENIAIREIENFREFD